QTVAEAQAYQSTNIEILANTDSVQVVYHKMLKLYGLTFFKACSFTHNNLNVESSAGCVMLVKNADTETMTVTVADPQKQASPIKIGIKTPSLIEFKAVTYQNPASPYEGKSLEFTVDNQTPKYEGKEVLLDRSGWIIIASSEGPVDGTVAPAGDMPEYMIDGDQNSAFLFVKPGKTYAGISVPAGGKPWFAIDMQQVADMTYILYRHRDYNNTLTSLRASKGSFYGKNSDAEGYQPIMENFDMATDVSEVRIDFPAKVSYRYVKFVMEAWDTASGSTIQVSEFNIGNLKQTDTSTDIGNAVSENDNLPVILYPNPVKVGQPFYLQSNKNLDGSTISVYTLSGIKVREIEAKSSQVGLTLDKQGLYFVEVKKDKKILVQKTVVN
ncbi:MAG: polysaccharide lyase beta-sandwich domain-containing protein, partial [Parachlamydiaceae bacterium]